MKQNNQALTVRPIATDMLQNRLYELTPHRNTFTTSITIKHLKSERMWPNWVLKTGSHDHIQGTETVALTHYLMQ